MNMNNRAPLQQLRALLDDGAITKRLTVGGAVKNEGSPVGALIADHEANKQGNWTHKDWRAHLKELRADTTRVYLYIEQEGKS